MRGKWVWAVNLLQGKIEGTNSVYLNKDMAIRKIKRLEKEPLFVKQKLIPKLRRVMYFEDIVKEDSFDDYCSICGGQLLKKEPLTETYKSSLNKK